jgi:hypothetical protein
MKLTASDALARLAVHDHGILCTRHAERGVDAVPVAYAMDDGWVGVPVDLVKPKASLRLQRERNLEDDPRATLLVERWDRADWSRLWWVRAELRWEPDADVARVALLSGLLEARYPQYRGQPFARVLVLRIVGMAGWSATDAEAGAGDRLDLHHRLRLRVLDGALAVCRLPAGSPRPAWAVGGPLVAVTATEHETSVVCGEAVVPDGVRCEPGWRALMVAGPLDFGLTGVLAAVAVPLRDAGVSIFAVSTYDTDYVLVRSDRLQEAAAALRSAGHTVSGASR